MSFIGDTSKVLVGVTIQRIMSLIMIPVIARLLGPKDYGIYNIAFSICTILAILGSLSLETSVAVAENGKIAAERTFGTALIGILAGIVLWVIAYWSFPLLLNYYSKDILCALLFMIPVFIPLITTTNSLKNYIGYIDKFSYIAFSDVVAPIANYTSFVLFYLFLWKDYRSLMAASIVQLLARLFIYIIVCSRSIKYSNNISGSSVFNSLWSARHFTIFNLPSNVINTMSRQLPPVLLSTVFSTNMVGLFIMAKNIIAIPTNLSARALGQVFYPKAAKEYRKNNGNITDITWSTFVYSCQLTIYPAVFTAMVSSFILPLLLGPKWRGVAPYLVILLPMVLLNAVQTQIGIRIIFSILGQQYKILIGNILLFILQMLPLIIGIHFLWSSHLTILSYSMGGAIGYAILLGWIFKATSISFKKAFITWLKYCLIAFLFSAPVLGSAYFEQAFSGIILISISIASYSIFAWKKLLTYQQRSLVVSYLHGLTRLKYH